MTHGNGLVTTAAYDQDYRLLTLTVKDGATNVSSLKERGRFPFLEESSLRMILRKMGRFPWIRQNLTSG